jgi:hypothetical protein
MNQEIDLEKKIGKEKLKKIDDFMSSLSDSQYGILQKYFSLLCDISSPQMAHFLVTRTPETNYVLIEYEQLNQNLHLPRHVIEEILTRRLSD